MLVESPEVMVVSPVVVRFAEVRLVFCAEFIVRLLALISEATIVSSRLMLIDCEVSRTGVFMASSFCLNVSIFCCEVFKVLLAAKLLEAIAAPT